MIKRKGIAILLILSMVIGLPQLAERAWATTSSEKKEQYEDQLDKTNSEIEDIEDSQQAIEDEIKNTRNQLVKLLQQMEELEEEIADTTAAVAKTEKDLEQARIEAQEQYEAMVLRIQYMYENSGQNSLIEAIVGAESLADLLKRVEYVAAVHKADRELTEQYKVAVQTVEKKQETLLVQMDELLMKQEIFLGQQAEINAMLADLGEMRDEYASQLASAQAKAEEYQKQIEIQEEIMRKEEEERKRREEEERKRREEEEKKKQEEAEKNQNQNQNGGTSNEVASNPKAQEIVDYALQFVGNPYVWGGNSLTDGCDCSGFVNLVYKHFGYNVPRYSMSFLYVGEKVEIEDIQPGDIVIYEKKAGVGHVAIYIGNGKIVEAQSSKTGITSNRNLQHNRGIAGIRRIVED